MGRVLRPSLALTADSARRFPLPIQAGWKPRNAPTHFGKQAAEHLPHAQALTTATGQKHNRAARIAREKTARNPFDCCGKQVTKV